MMPRGRVCLADFGAARRGRRTVRSEGSGTPSYMAPEQMLGRPCPRSDLFAVGRVLYEMLIGKLPARPYTGGITDKRRGLSAAWEPFMQQALHEEPSHRFRSAEEMLAALRVLRRAHLRRFRSRNVAASRSHHAA